MPGSPVRGTFFQGKTTTSFKIIEHPFIRDLRMKNEVIPVITAGNQFS